jgi:nucleotide-sensitive chloride channel 1A
MQLEFETEQDESYDDEAEPIDVTLLTSASGSLPNAPTNSIQSLFDAVSNCSNLNPDPQSQEDEDMEDDSRIVFEGNVGYEGISGLPGALQGASDGGLPPPFPGSGGWITAENVGDYFDADGNWIGGGEQEILGEGAGRVRGRDEVDDEGGEGLTVNGHGTNGEEEHKKPRTE